MCVHELWLQAGFNIKIELRVRSLLYTDQVLTPEIDTNRPIALSEKVSRVNGREEQTGTLEDCKLKEKSLGVSLGLQILTALVLPVRLLPLHG